MATVSWGAPSLEFIELAASTGDPTAADWTGMTGYVKIPGDILLENSSQLNTTEGETKELRNEFGEIVDKKTMPSSYAFVTSVIKKKGETVVSSAFSPVNGIVDGNWAMRLIAEDAATPGFLFRKCTIATAKGWNSQQGSLDNLTVNGVIPDGTDKEICKDYSVSGSGSGSD